MAVYLSPGVYVQETDLSQIVQAIGGSTSAIVINASMGPVLEPVLITSDKQFVETFGKPNAKLGYGQYAAIAFLQQGNALYVVRAPSTGQARAENYFNAVVGPVCHVTALAAAGSPEASGLSFPYTGTNVTIASNVTFEPNCWKAWAGSAAGTSGTPELNVPTDFEAVIYDSANNVLASAQDSNISMDYTSWGTTDIKIAMRNVGASAVVANVELVGF